MIIARLLADFLTDVVSWRQNRVMGWRCFCRMRKPASMWFWREVKKGESGSTLVQFLETRIWCFRTCGWPQRSAAVVRWYFWYYNRIAYYVPRAGSCKELQSTYERHSKSHIIGNLGDVVNAPPWPLTPTSAAASRNSFRQPESLILCFINYVLGNSYFSSTHEWDEMLVYLRNQIAA